LKKRLKSLRKNLRQLRQKRAKKKNRRKIKMSRAKLNGLFSLAREMRKAGAITAAEYQRITEYLKKLSAKIGG
jgi:hypothetical protein